MANCLQFDDLRESGANIIYRNLKKGSTEAVWCPDVSNKLMNSTVAVISTLLLEAMAVQYGAPKCSILNK